MLPFSRHAAASTILFAVFSCVSPLFHSLHRTSARACACLQLREYIDDTEDYINIQVGEWEAAGSETSCCNPSDTCDAGKEGGSRSE